MFNWSVGLDDSFQFCFEIFHRSVAFDAVAVYRIGVGGYRVRVRRLVIGEQNGLFRGAGSRSVYSIRYIVRSGLRIRTFCLLFVGAFL